MYTPIAFYIHVFQALDIWLITCFFFTFLNLLEFCLILAISKNGNNKEKELQEDTKRKRAVKKTKKKTTIGKIERASKMIIPIFFVLFAVAFLGTFLQEEKAIDDGNGRGLFPLETAEILI